MRRGKIYSFLTASALILLTISVSVGSFGCGATKKAAPVVKKPRPLVRAPRKMHISSSLNGSLWPTRGQEPFLFTDHKARKVNDVVTVRIVEESKATKAASTKTAKSSSLQAGLNSLFGIEKSIALRNPNFNPASAIDTSVGNTFDGSGTTSRSESITATITATVQRVLPSGNLLIRGSREIFINNEKQFMYLSGIVRPQDISPFNAVLSTAIADLKISYSGSGVLSEKQRPGWFTRVVDQLWPF